ncbi:MAG: AarF/ABC1/UbiB kinase family protein [Actinobacteria bacterium]|nr:AarF/ABC1/UbiB kinase family protein [Actinomycetota bacterium]
MVHSPGSTSRPDPATTGQRPSQRLGGRVQRGADLARLSATTGAGYLTSRVRGLRAGEEAELAFHVATAEKVLELLGSMKGAAMKLGQIASFVDLDLPPEIQSTYQGALSNLRTAAPPVDPELIAEVVHGEFGAPPERVFSRWDPWPLASASIGQVHRASLPGGGEVVVKVQYPGVAEAVESDLANAEALAPVAKLISPNLRLRPLVEELRARLVDELDYQREAQYQHAFFARYDGHPFVRVPRVHGDFCRPRVLVSEYIDGLGFDEMLAVAGPAERRRYGEIIYRFVFGSLHRFRLFNADPHPGNYLFLPDGSVAFLDFGSVKMFRREIREQIRRQLHAVIDGDIDRLMEVMRAAGFVPEGVETDPEALMAWFRRFNEPVLQDREWTYTPEFARDIIRSTTDPRLGPVDLLRRLNLPADYLMLNRIQWGVNSILGQLRAAANWRRISEELWDGAPPASDLGRRERPFIDASPYLA